MLFITQVAKGVYGGGVEAGGEVDEVDKVYIYPKLRTGHCRSGREKGAEPPWSEQRGSIILLHDTRIYPYYILWSSAPNGIFPEVRVTMLHKGRCLIELLVLEMLEGIKEGFLRGDASGVARDRCWSLEG